MKRALVIVCFITILATLMSCLEEVDLPALTTTEVSNIKTRTASSGGTITSDGGTEINKSGVCWGLANNPTVENSISIGRKEGIGSFVCLLYDLTPDTYYHVRAFASNRVGTSYGNEVHFRTKQIIAPEVTTIAKPLAIGLAVISLEGNITCYDDMYILHRGFCWSTTEYPIINNNFVTCGSGPGIFTGDLSPLNPGTHYYVRAYAVTLAGITYGNEIQIATHTLTEVTTAPVTEISGTSAKVHVNINDPLFVYSAGICYGTSAGPTINEYSLSTNTIGYDTVFTFTLTNLIPVTLYYTRAFVMISDGGWWDPNYTPKFIIYGNEVTFTTKQQDYY